MTLATQSILFVGGSTNWLTIVQGDASRRVSLPNDTNSSDFAEQVSSQLQVIGYDRQPILLALASERCLATTLAIQDGSRDDYMTRVFRLEEELPLDAEQVVADFAASVAGENGNTALAVAVDRIWMSAVVEALESKGVAVGSIVPAALLAAQLKLLNSKEEQLFILNEPVDRAVGTSAVSPLNFIHARSGLPIGWSTVNATASDLKTQLEWQSLDLDTRKKIGLIGVAEEIRKTLGGLNGFSFESFAGSSEELATAAGAAILCGEHRPLIDLRRGPLATKDSLRLYRQSLNAALAAVAILLLAVTVGLGSRAWRYSQQTGRNQVQMESAFRKTFPGWSMPASIPAVVESEHRKFAAMPLSADRRSAVMTMHDVLAHFPTSADVSIQHISFSPVRFDLTGQLKNYPAADELAAALRGVSGFTVDPPQARKVDEGHWTFSLSGSAGVKK